MYLNINEQIKKHMTTSDGAAEYLRKKAPGFSCGIERFFEARSDVRRLQEAEKLAALILNIYDFGEIHILRKKVATLELKRLVDYKKQTDHTAHTVYMFLLGIWIFDCSELVKRQFIDHGDDKKNINTFIFQWMFASLLHDIGYVFFELEDMDFEFYGKLFSFEWIFDNTGKREDSNNTIKNLWRNFTANFKIPNIDKPNDPMKVIGEIRAVPWLKEIGDLADDGLQLLTLENDTERKLEKFTNDVAKSGYDGESVGRVDHAVASGLMLLQYTSIWYWISKELNEETVKKEYLKDFKYPKEKLLNDVIPACKAVAYHNIPGHMMKIEIEKNPLLYLAILCDEMQMWDRFPAGGENLDNWSIDVQIMAEDIITEKVLSESGTVIVDFRPINLSAGDKLIKTLDKRLESWKDIIQIR